jgi:threonine dehydrogenase-like Zn-dependent dehydrogenase
MAGGGDRAQDGDRGAPDLDPAERAEAFWCDGGGGEIRLERVPAPGPDEVLVRALWSGVSRGTETLVYRGAVPVEERQRMRAPFQSGEFGGPVKYGYCSVGVVEAGRPDLIGQPVFCLFPHQTRYVVPAASVHPIPSAVPPARAVLAANLETAVNGIWDARPSVGDRICVIGGGVVGLLTGWLAASLPGCEVELLDPNPERAEVARLLGMRPVAADAVTPDADLVIHASGQPAGLEAALRIAGAEATIIEMSWFGTAPVVLPLGGAFHSRRLTVRASQVGSIPSGQRARWTHGRRLALVMRLLADPRLDALVSGDTDFADLPNLMARLATGDPSVANALCERIRYAPGPMPPPLRIPR